MLHFRSREVYFSLNKANLWVTRSTFSFSKYRVPIFLYVCIYIYISRHFMTFLFAVKQVELLLVNLLFLARDNNQPIDIMFSAFNGKIDLYIMLVYFTIR